MISHQKLLYLQDVAFVLLISALTYLIFLRNRRTNGLHPLPPAPRGLPFFGNFFQIPSVHYARHLQKVHHELNSPIVRLSAFGQHIIDVSDPNLLKELFEKSGKINSSRPSTLYFEKYVDPVGRYWSMAPNDHIHFRVGRELTHQAMLTVKQGRTHRLQEMEARCSLDNLLRLSENGDVTGWIKEVSRFVVSITTGATFGFRCISVDEPRIVKLFEVLDGAIRGATAVSIINFLPILDKIPGPMPWRASAERYLHEASIFHEMLLKEAIEGKSAQIDTWARQFLRDQRPEEIRDMKSELKPILMVMAAIETTNSTMMSFILAYMLYPEAFTKVIEQINEVVGLHRLPDFDDESNLFLVEATYRETLRWRPTGPQGLPHSSVEDQVLQVKDSEGNIKEYFIPKASVIFANEYAIDSDSNKWDEPEKFKIERWLDENGRLRNWSSSPSRPFGYGRRECPGRSFAEKSLFILMSSILWGFRVEKVTDFTSAHNYQYSDTNYTGQLIDAPKPFPCRFVTRTSHHRDVIRKTWEAHEKDLNILMPLVD